MDGWTNKFLEVVFKHLVHIYCDYSSSNIFEMRGEKDCPSGELEREFNNSFFFKGCLMLECDCFITCSDGQCFNAESSHCLVYLE